MLFDFATMSADEQSSAKQSAIDFLNSRMEPADALAVMAVDSGRVSVVQDFTDDHAVLEGAIRRLGAADTDGSVAGRGPRLSSIEAAAKLLAAIPDRKALIYFSSGLERPEVNDPAQLASSIETLRRSNVALYPIDARGLVPRIPMQTAVAARPESPQTAPGGAPGDAAELAEALRRESQDRRTATMAKIVSGLPGRHLSQIYPVGKSRLLSVPLDSLSGKLDIIGQIKTRPVAGAAVPVAAIVRDSVQASAGTYQATFILDPGSYVCTLLVREQATERMFTETIDFDVK
jgi:hypothetical protein